MTYVDNAAFEKSPDCADDKKAMEDACSKEEACPGVLSVPKSEQRAAVDQEILTGAFADHQQIIKKVAAAGGSRTERAAAAGEAEADANECVKKSRCYLRPYQPTATQDGCCPGQTGHHIPPQSCFSGASGYSHSGALCVCLEGMSQHFGSHGKNHAAIDWLAEKTGIAHGSTCSRTEYNSLCAATVEAQCGCNKKCIEAQLNQQFTTIKNVKHVDTNSSAPLSDDLKNKVVASAGLPVNAPAGNMG